MTPLGIVLASIVLSIFSEGVQCRLPCQSQTRKRDFQPSRSPAAEKPESLTSRNPFPVKPNLCCEAKPFNSGYATCCMGKVVGRSVKRCCLSGEAVLRERRCSCDPHPDWIRHQSDVLYGLETNFRSITEVLEDAKAQLIEAIYEKEGLVRELDATANSLYTSFLDEINIQRNQDPEEVQYIYDLVTFLHTHEKEELNREEMEGERSNDEEMGNTNHVPEENPRKYSSRSSSFIRRLLNTGRARSFVNSTLGQKMLAARNMTTLPSGIELKSLIGEAREVLTWIKSEVDENMRENEDEIERLIMEHNEIKQQISGENEIIYARKRRLQLVEQILQMFIMDIELIVQLRELLDIALEEVITASDNLEGELEQVEIETEDSEGGSFDTIRFPTPLKIPPPSKIRFADPPSQMSTPLRNKRSAPQFSDFDGDYEEIKEYSYYIPEEGNQPLRVTSSAESSTEELDDVTIETKMAEPGCDVSRWIAYIDNFTKRVEVAKIDLNDILVQSSEGLASNVVGNDPIPQRQNMFVSRIGERRYNLDNPNAFIRLKKLLKLSN